MMMMIITTVMMMMMMTTTKLIISTHLRILIKFQPKLDVSGPESIGRVVGKERTGEGGGEVERRNAASLGGREGRQGQGLAIGSC